MNISAQQSAYRLMAVRGFTLMEIVIVTAIFGLAMAVAFSFMMRSSDQIAVISEEASLQGQVQRTIDTLVTEMQESKATQITFYRWLEGTYTKADGSTGTTNQVAICMATARNKAGDYVFGSATSGSSTISVASEPVWQSLVVYAYYNGSLYKYSDFNTSSYSDTLAFSISSITSTTITLSGGSPVRTVTFTRSGTSSTTQKTDKLMGRLCRLDVYQPSYTATSTGAKFEGAWPAQLTLIAQQKVSGGSLNSVSTQHKGYTMVEALISTEALARHKN